MKRYTMRLTVTLTAQGLELPAVAAHPNRVPFRGILTRVDSPSDKPPGGAQGHCVLIPRAAAEAAIPSLMGMGVNVAPQFDDHNERFKVGIFTAADLEGNALVVHGLLYAKDFPKEVAFIQANTARLGLSFEITDVQIADTAAPIWTLNAFVFTGAAILWKDAAAYRSTALAAAQEKEKAMTKAEQLKAQKAELHQKLDDLRTMTAAITALEAEATAEDQDAGVGPGGGTPSDAMLQSMERMMKTMMESAMAPLMTRMGAMESSMQKAAAASEAVTTQKGEHEDEAEDKAMLKRIMERVDSMATTDATEKAAAEDTKASAALTAMDDRLGKIEAALKAIGMHTDTTATMGGLQTDSSTSSKTLRTDSGATTPNGGPMRRTVTAKDLSHFAAKYVDAGQTYTEEKLDAVLKQHPIDPEARMAIKHELATLGILQ